MGNDAVAIIVMLLALLAVGLYIAAIMFIAHAIRARPREARSTVPRREARLPPHPRPWLPMDEADERHARRWGDHGPSGLTSAQWKEGRAFPTRRGELVRSRGEVRVADWLHANGLHYAYEPAVCGHLRPDFLLPREGVIIEYWGLEGVDYLARRRQKTAIYLQAGYRLVSLEPGKEVPLEEDLRRQLWHKGVRLAPNDAGPVAAA